DVATCAGWKTDWVGHKPGSQGQPGIERAPRDIRTGNDGLVQEAKRELSGGSRRSARTSGRKQAQARPGRCGNGSCCGRKVLEIGASKHEPKAEEPNRSPGSGRPPAPNGRGGSRSNDPPPH